MQPRQSTPIRAPTLDLTPEQIARHTALITKAAGPVVNIKAQRAHTEMKRQAAAGVGTKLQQALQAAEEASRQQQAHLSASVTKRDDPPPNTLSLPPRPDRPAVSKPYVPGSFKYEPVVRQDVTLQTPAQQEAARVASIQADKAARQHRVKTLTAQHKQEAEVQRTQTYQAHMASTQAQQQRRVASKMQAEFRERQQAGAKPKPVSLLALRPQLSRALTRTRPGGGRDVTHRADVEMKAALQRVPDKDPLPTTPEFGKFTKVSMRQGALPRPPIFAGSVLPVAKPSKKEERDVLESFELRLGSAAPSTVAYSADPTTTPSEARTELITTSSQLAPTEMLTASSQVAPTVMLPPSVARMSTIEEEAKSERSLVTSAGRSEAGADVPWGRRPDPSVRLPGGIIPVPTAQKPKFRVAGQAPAPIDEPSGSDTETASTATSRSRRTVRLPSLRSALPSVPDIDIFPTRSQSLIEEDKTYSRHKAKLQAFTREKAEKKKREEAERRRFQAEHEHRLKLQQERDRAKLKTGTGAKQPTQQPAVPVVPVTKPPAQKPAAPWQKPQPKRKTEQKTEQEEKSPSVEHVDVHVPEVPPKKPAPAIVTDPDPKRRRQKPVVTADPDPIKGRFRHTFGGGPPSSDPTTSSATHSSTAGWSSHWTSQGRHMEETGTERSGYTSVGRMSSTDSSKSDFPEENIDIARQHRRKARSVSSGSAPRVEEEHIDIAQRRRRKAPVYTTAESEGRRESEDIFPTRSTSAPPDRPERRLPPPRRRLTITEKQHRKYQRERARKDAEAAKPVVPVPPRVDTRPQIIVLPGAGGGRAGPPGRPALPALRVVAVAGQGRQLLQRPPGRRAPLGRHASPRRRRRRRRRPASPRRRSATPTSARSRWQRCGA